jgi:hypothetical protein
LLPYLSASQLLGWQAYTRQYGLPPRRNDIHHGMSMALLYNANKSEKTRSEPPCAFMPYWIEPDYPDTEETAEEFAARLFSLIPKP